MNEPADAAIEASRLVARLKKGTKLCCACPPVYDELKKVLRVCVADLPVLPIFTVDGPHLHEHVPTWIKGGTAQDDTDLKLLADEYKRIPLVENPKWFLIEQKRMFARVDVVRFSEYPHHQQPLVMADVNSVTLNLLKNDNYRNHQPERIIPLGDGFVLAWSKVDYGALHFTIDLAASLDHLNDRHGKTSIHFRMSLVAGPVFLVDDLEGKTNYLGEAITEGERLISCMPANLDDLVYCNQEVFRQFRSAQAAAAFTRLGTHKDKHGRDHRIYSLNYDVVGPRYTGPAEDPPRV